MSPEKGGALRTQNDGRGRALLALLFGGALLVLPLLLVRSTAPPGQAARSPSRAVAVRAVAVRRVLPMPGSAVVDFEVAAAPPATTTTTTTTATPTTTTTTTPTPAPAPTPATAAAVNAAPTPPASPAVSSSATGVATWYAEAPPGYCASPTLPFGTDVQVVNDASGATTSCVVDDREASNPGRVVDMSPTGFSQIATPSQGVVTVTISW